MGFKSLFPLCLHLSVLPEQNPTTTAAATATVRLILSTGRLRTFRRTLPAGELMAANPLHLVCRSDSFFIGQKVPPLAAGDLLALGQSYFLFPSAFFSAPLSFASLAAAAAAGGGGGGGGGGAAQCKLLLLRPFEIRKTEEGRLQLRVSDEFVERLGAAEEEEERRKEGMVCTTEKMEREYRELVVRARLWRPKLETICELERRRRGGGFGGIMRKEKKGSGLFIR